MVSIGTHVAEWFRHHLSSAITFQKQFVDDVSETVKEQKAQFDRHAREANERAVQLHLDHLEEKYLCCVCGRGGEMREDDEFVYDTYSMVRLPHRTTLEAAVREELADAELSEERNKQRQRMYAEQQRRSIQSSTLTDSNGSGKPSSSTTAPNKSGIPGAKEALEGGRYQKNRSACQPVESPPPWQRTAVENDHGGGQRGRIERSGSENEQSDSYSSAPVSTRSAAAPHATRMAVGAPIADLVVMDPDMVGPLDVRNTLYKIRHAVLHKEARVRRKAVVVHKDKGLMMIEEAEIDMFSHFFQRPVHGYLCMACYTSARRRLDTLTQQIRTILFKASHPLLRRISAKELEALKAGNQVPETVVQSIVAVQQQWAKLTQENRRTMHHADRSVAETDSVVNFTVAGESENRTSDGTQPNGSTAITATLSEKSILIIREQVKCGACQRRFACFFEPKSIVFVCQFCTARDRFYREHTICINDEEMPLELAHLLQDLADYYQAAHQQMELRQAPLSAVWEAYTDLFPITEIMRVEGGLFSCQDPAATTSVPHNRAETAAIKPAYHGEAAAAVDIPVVGPSLSATTARHSTTVPLTPRSQRQRVKKTMVSLFDGIKVDRSSEDLFNRPFLSPSAASALSPPVPFQSAQVPPTPTTIFNGTAKKAGAQGRASALFHSPSADDGDIAAPSLFHSQSTMSAANATLETRFSSAAAVPDTEGAPTSSMFYPPEVARHQSWDSLT